MLIIPVLFLIFIDGLARAVKAKREGVKLGNLNINVLLFADDIVLIADNEHDLQVLLDVVVDYSRKWDFNWNVKKSNIVVFSTRRNPVKTNLFLGVQRLDQVPWYKYLGLELDAKLKYKECVDKSHS